MKRVAVCLLVGCVLSTGCSQFNETVKTPSWLSPDSSKASKYDEPVRIAVVWSYDMIAMKGHKPTPGFGGRFYFYNKENKAIAVDGDLVVYAYDDSKGIESGREPDARFAYTADQFKKHFKETDLGASYNIWVPVPWHNPTDASRSISLVPVFNSHHGSRLVGNQSTNVLQGRNYVSKPSPTGNHPEPARAGGVQPAAHEEVMEAPQRTPEETSAMLHEKARNVRKRIRTTTIPLSKGLTRQAQINQGTPSVSKPLVLNAGSQQGANQLLTVDHGASLGAPRRGRNSNLGTLAERLDGRSRRPKTLGDMKRGAASNNYQQGVPAPAAPAGQPAAPTLGLPYNSGLQAPAQPVAGPAPQGYGLGLPMQN